MRIAPLIETALLQLSVNQWVVLGHIYYNEQTVQTVKNGGYDLLLIIHQFVKWWSNFVDFSA